MRLLDRANAPLDLAELGYNPVLRGRLEALLDLPSGMLLVTGPTGSGKSSTLYAALSLLNTRERKILTIRRSNTSCQRQPDPGYAGDRAQTRHPAALAAASGPRHHAGRPGKSDLETAHRRAGGLTENKLQHLSTLHTNDAVGTVVRLIDMGLEDYLVAAVLKGVVAQRLVRSLCVECREPHGDYHRAVGCDSCAGTGYRGRTAIAELLTFDETFARLVVARAGAEELREAALAGGMIDLRNDGLARREPASPRSMRYCA